MGRTYRHGGSASLRRFKMLSLTSDWGDVSLPGRGSCDSALEPIDAEWGRVPIEATSFPHIIEAIIDAAPFDLLTTFRLVSHKTKARAERRLYRSLILIDPGEKEDWFELRAPASEFGATGATCELHVPVPRVVLRMDGGNTPETMRLAAQVSWVMRHLRVLEPRMGQGHRGCALRAALERPCIPLFGRIKLEALRQHSTSPLALHTGAIVTDLDVRFVSLTNLTGCLGSLPYNAKRIVVNISFETAFTFYGSHLLRFTHAWIPEGITYRDQCTALVFAFRPFLQAMVSPVLAQGLVGEPERGAFGILHEIIGLAARFPRASLTLVGLENLAPGTLYVAAGLDLDTDKGRRKLAAIVEQKISKTRTRDRRLERVKVDCVSELSYRQSIGDKQYRLQMGLPQKC